MINVLDISMKNWQCPQCEIGYEKGCGLVNASPPEEKWYDSDDGKYIYCRKCELYWSESEIKRGESIMSDDNDKNKDHELTDLTDGRIEDEELDLETLEETHNEINKKPETDINKFEMYRVMDVEAMKSDIEAKKQLIKSLTEERDEGEKTDYESLLKETLICLHVYMKPVMYGNQELDTHRAATIKSAMDAVAIGVMGEPMFYDDQEEESKEEQLELELTG